MQNTIENYQLTAHAAAQLRAETVRAALVRLQAIALPTAGARFTLALAGCALVLVAVMKSVA